MRGLFIPPALALLLACALCCGLAACTRNPAPAPGGSLEIQSHLAAPPAAAAEPGSGVTPPPGPALAAIPFPADDAPPRAAAVPTPVIIPGSNRTLESANAHVDGTQMVLPAAPGELEWATYSLPTNGYPALSVQVQLVMLGGLAWFGIANFARNGWEFSPAVAEPAYSRPVSVSHLSPGGRVHIVVAAYDAVTVRVVSAGIVLDQPGWAITTIDSCSATTPVSAIRLFSDGPDDVPHLATLSRVALDLYTAGEARPQNPGDWDRVRAAAGGVETGLSWPLEAQFINGKPAMAYIFDGEDYQLRYTYATVADPEAGDWVTVDVGDTLAYPVLSIGLCELERKPRILYEDNDADVVRLASSPTAIPGPGDWSVSTVIEGGARCALALVNGRLACTYLAGGAYSTSLYYAVTDEASPAGPGDWESHDVWGPTSVNYYMMTDLAATPLAGQQAPIALLKFGSGESPHIECASVAEPAAPGDWESAWLDPHDDVGGFSMAIEMVGGRPAVVYYLESARKLQLAVAENDNPASADDWRISTLLSAADIGKVALDDVGGEPVVAFVDQGLLELRFACYDD